jgi:hypothetical protein
MDFSRSDVIATDVLEKVAAAYDGLGSSTVTATTTSLWIDLTSIVVLDRGLVKDR